MSPTHGRDGELWSGPRDKMPGPRRPPLRRGKWVGTQNRTSGSFLAGPLDRTLGPHPATKGELVSGRATGRQDPTLKPRKRLGSRPRDRTLGPHPRLGGNSGWNPVGVTRGDPGQPSFSASSGPSKQELFSLRALSHALTIFSSFRVLQRVPCDLG